MIVTSPASRRERREQRLDMATAPSAPPVQRAAWRARPAAMEQVGRGDVEQAEARARRPLSVSQAASASGAIAPVKTIAASAPGAGALQPIAARERVGLPVVVGRARPARSTRVVRRR